MKQTLLKCFPLIILIIFYALFLRDFFRWDATMNIFPDNEWFLGAVFSFESSSIRNFELPLWMNTILGGLPLYNSPQISPYYPFYFLYLDIYKTPIDSIYSIHIITMIHIAILEVGSYILLRTLRLSTIAALVGTLFITFNLNTIEIMKWAHVIASFSWIPLYSAGLIMLLESSKSKKGIILTIISFLMITFSQIGQPLVLAGVLTVFIILGYSIQKYVNGEKKDSIVTILRISLIFIIAMLLAAPFLLPVVLGIPEMIRWIGGDATVIGHALIPFDKFLADQLYFFEIPSFIYNLNIKHDISNAYIGLFPVFFSLIAIFNRKYHWIILPIAMLALYSFLSSLGSNSGLAYLNYKIPVINKIREPSYFLLLLHLSIGILAAIGIDILLKDIVNKAIHKALYISIGLALFSVVIVFFSTITIIDYYSIVVPLVALIFSSSIFFIFKTNNYKKIAFSIIVVSFSIFIQFTSVKWLSPSISNSEYLRLNLASLELAFSKVKELDPTHDYRVIFGGDIHKQGAAMIGSFHGIRSLNSYIIPIPLEQFEQMYSHGPRNDKYNNGIGVKYLICKKCSSEETSGFEQISEVGEYSIFSINQALPRTYISNNLLGEFIDSADYVNKLTNSNLDSKPLFIEVGNHNFETLDSSETLSCTQKTDIETLNKLRVIVDCSSSGFFILNEYYSTPWKAFVNGRNVEPLKINGNQIGVYFQKGTHIIEFSYSPNIMKIAFAFFISGIIFFILVIIFTKNKE